jgi:S-adenosylmethionine decarboxylase
MSENIFEHFLKEDGEISAGNHLIVDMWGIVNHTDHNAIMNCFEQACKDAGATVLFKHCHSFGEGYGTTGVIVLSESHLSYHHFNEAHLISVDIFMCGNAKPELAMPRIIEFWKPTHQDVKSFKRGIVEKHKLPEHLQDYFPEKGNI